MLGIELCYLLRTCFPDGQDEPSFQSSTANQYICDFLLAYGQFVVTFLIHQHNPHSCRIVSSVHEISEEPDPVGVPAFQFTSIQSQLACEFLDLTMLEGSKEDPEFSRCLDIYLFIEANLT